MGYCSFNDQYLNFRVPTSSRGSKPSNYLAAISEPRYSIVVIFDWPSFNLSYYCRFLCHLRLSWNLLASIIERKVKLLVLCHSTLRGNTMRPRTRHERCVGGAWPGMVLYEPSPSGDHILLIWLMFMILGKTDQYEDGNVEIKLMERCRSYSNSENVRGEVRNLTINPFVRW